MRQSSFESEKNDTAILVKGAKVHNLRNLTVRIPRDQLVVITGPSGSGKSSLAFDTIYAEGQRRYVESMSVYARQFIDQLGKPDVESISGLSPTISIVQKTTSFNSRSTVGTITEIYDYLRVLFARIGKPYCWSCGKPIQSQSPQQIVDSIMASEENSKLIILAPIIRGRKGEHKKELLELRQRGFVRVRIDGLINELTDDLVIDKNKKHDIEVVIDRLVIKGDRGLLVARIGDSVELALKIGNGFLLLHNLSDKEPVLLSEKFACTDCGISYPEAEPRSFSFNSPTGACPVCDGLGFIKEEPPDKSASDNDLDIPIIEKPCKVCNGTRLRKESLHFKINNKNIAELCSISISELKKFFSTIKLSEKDRLIADRIIREITDRLVFLDQVGVGYLDLSRSANTLAGGEAQRIRLATQIGSSLVGVVYVLDEPSIGLHPRDHDKLLSSLNRLRDMGNTVLVVEHDRETIERADWIIDLGPGAGELGGTIVGEGNLKTIKATKSSLTGKYLTGSLEIPYSNTRRPWDPAHVLTITGANRNNLKNVTATIPLGLFTCVTGVSGSGKSTLIIETLYRLLLRSVYKVTVGDLKIASFSGLEHVDKVVDINQSAIGRTPRSNPATYTGLFSIIRDLFASLPESQVRGYKAGHFSFNVKGGRCETCEGAGLTKIKMHFLPDVYVLCETCHGARYNQEALSVRYKGKNIAESLDMTANEALHFFDAIPGLKNKLSVLSEVGLGYIRLGQNATTLSGGEAQRIKLARELSRKGTGRTVYILDEPTTGLHFDDIQKLIKILQKLADQGNTVIVIEHNLDIIKVADHVIDMGPDGGDQGGKILAAGTPEEIAKLKVSVTGKYLKPYLHLL